MTKLLDLHGGHVAIVDDEDYDMLSQFKWYVMLQSNTLYALCLFTNPDGTRTLRKMHIMLTGFEMTDHKNGNGLDNRRCNLRATTRVLNSMNSFKRTGTTSKYKGVTWSKPMNKWLVRVQAHGHRIHIGYFSDEDEAGRAYDKVAYEIFGNYARLNFPFEDDEPDMHTHSLI